MFEVTKRDEFRIIGVVNLLEMQCWTNVLPLPGLTFVLPSRLNSSCMTINACFGTGSTHSHNVSPSRSTYLNLRNSSYSYRTSTRWTWSNVSSKDSNETLQLRSTFTAQTPLLRQRCGPFAMMTSSSVLTPEGLSMQEIQPE